MRLALAIGCNLYSMMQLAPGEGKKLTPQELLGIPSYWWFEWDSDVQANRVVVWPAPMEGMSVCEVKVFDFDALLPGPDRGLV
jgi:hypothetical protein